MAERRPIATRDTDWAKALAARIARTGLSANAISVLSTVFAVAAGAAIFPPHALPFHLSHVSSTSCTSQ
jgi:hypothetical protein